MRFNLSMLLVATVAFAVALPARRAGAQVARVVVEEATEQIFKQAGREGLEQLGEMGGKAAVRELLEQSGREGGQSLVEKVSQYGLEHGPMALRAIARSPMKMVAALDGLSPELRSAGLAAMEREPAVLTPLVERYGSSALEAAARQPGIGAKLLQTLGADATPLTRSLSTDQSILLARHAEEIASLPAAQRAGLLANIGKAPTAVLGYIESHPNILKTAAGVAIVMAIRTDLIGRSSQSTVMPDGTVVTTPAQPGLIERLATPVIAAGKQPSVILAYALGGGVALWLFMHAASRMMLRRVR